MQNVRNHRNSTIIFTQNKKTWTWRAETLWESAKNLEIIDFPVEDLIKELNKDRWFQDYQTPTVINIMHHFTRVLNADLQFPIILSESHNVLDGTHRLVKAVLLEKQTIRAVVLPVLPESDLEFTNK